MLDPTHAQPQPKVKQHFHPAEHFPFWGAQAVINALGTKRRGSSPTKAGPLSHDHVFTSQPPIQSGCWRCCVCYPYWVHPTSGMCTQTSFCF